MEGDPMRKLLLGFMVLAVSVFAQTASAAPATLRARCSDLTRDPTPTSFWSPTLGRVSSACQATRRSSSSRFRA